MTLPISKADNHEDPLPTGREHMWSADVLLDAGSTRTAIMQIKSNTAGEPVYIQVYDTNGDLRNDGGSQIARSTRPPASAASGSTTRSWPPASTKKGGSGWYFKNGAYNNGMPGGA